MAKEEILLIGLGAQKSATSWLTKTLTRSADVHTRRKELRYWNRIRSPFTRWGMTHLKRKPEKGTEEVIFGPDPYDHSRYTTFLTERLKDRRISIDFSPEYALCSASTYAEMLAVHGNVKFVFVMRDPVDRLWSGTRHRFRGYLEKGMPQERLEPLFLSAAQDPDSMDFQLSDYRRTISRITQVIPQERVLFLFYETLFDEPALDKIRAFLDLDDFVPDTQEQVWSGVAQGARLSAAVRLTATDAFTPTYRYIHEMFAEQVPAKWFKPS